MQNKFLKYIYNGISNYVLNSTKKVLLTQETSTPCPGGLFISTGTRPVRSSSNTTPQLQTSDLVVKCPVSAYLLQNQKQKKICHLEYALHYCLKGNSFIDFHEDNSFIIMHYKSKMQVEKKKGIIHTQEQHIHGYPILGWTLDHQPCWNRFLLDQSQTLWH